MKTVDKLPPHDIDAEEATIGSLLIDGRAIDNIPFLNDEDFYNERNRWLYKACLEVDKRHEAINQITIASELERNGLLEECGGAAYLSHLVSATPTSMDLVHYANVVQRLSVSRQMISAGRSIEEMGYKADPDPSKVLNKADELLLDIRKKTVGTPIVTPKNRVDLLMERYENLYTKDQVVAIKTGIESLDFMLGGGMFSGELILLAARTGMGKTSFAQTIANNIGKSGKNVLYCSVEMSWQSLSDRDMSGILKIPISDIRMGKYSSDLFVRLIGEGLESLANISVFYYDDNPMTSAKIMNAGIEMKLRYGLSLIVVDYLGILGDEYGRTPYERVGYISRKVKQIARVLDVPVLALHQLSRALERQEDKRPQLRDLRDSGNLEEDADDVLFLYRENYYDETDVSNITEVLLGKQRQSDTGGHSKINLYFDNNSKSYKGVVSE